MVRLLLLQEASAVDYGRDIVSQGSGGHGAHGDPSRPPAGNSRPLVQQWGERFERMIEEAERDAEMTARGTAPAPLSQAQIAQRVRDRMPDYEGREPVYVAYHEGCSVELVRKVRREQKRHMVFGTKLESGERPLSAPPKHTLEAYSDLPETERVYGGAE